MNQKPTSMPICSLSMSARSCVRQLVNDESQSVSAEAPRGAAHQSTAIHALMSNRLTRCGCVGTPAYGANAVPAVDRAHLRASACVVTPSLRYTPGKNYVN